MLRRYIICNTYKYCLSVSSISNNRCRYWPFKEKKNIGWSQFENCFKDLSVCYNSSISIHHEDFLTYHKVDNNYLTHLRDSLVNKRHCTYQTRARMQIKRFNSNRVPSKLGDAIKQISISTVSHQASSKSSPYTLAMSPSNDLAH